MPKSARCHPTRIVFTSPSSLVAAPNKYHWALLVGPKLQGTDTTCTQYHAKERLTQDGQVEWIFEEVDASIRAMLVRVAIAKIKNRDRVADILRKVPIRQGKPGWNCIGWVMEALQLLSADDEALGTNVIEWEKVQDAAISYCQRKKDEHRFDGHGDFDSTTVATYDLMNGKEVVR